MTLTSLEIVMKAHKYLMLYIHICLAAYLIIKYDLLYIYESLAYRLEIETLYTYTNKQIAAAIKRYMYAHKLLKNHVNKINLILQNLF